MQFPQGCPWSGSVIRPSVAWLPTPLLQLWAHWPEPQTGPAECGVPQRHHGPASRNRTAETQNTAGAPGVGTRTRQTQVAVFCLVAVNASCLRQLGASGRRFKWLRD